MAEDWATRCHAPPTCRRVVVAAEEKSHVWRHMTHWLSPRLLLVCRSSDDEPNGGVAGRNGVVAETFHQRAFAGTVEV